MVADVIAEPSLFDELFSALQSGDALLRMRASDAVEKITARHPEYLEPYRKKLIEEVAGLDQKEVRWHVAQMVPRVRWNRAEQRQVMRVLAGYLNDRSSLVKTFAMQALADIAWEAPELRRRALLQVRELTVSGTPAMKARGRRLLSRIDTENWRTTGHATRCRATAKRAGRPRNSASAVTGNRR